MKRLLLPAAVAAGLYLVLMQLHEAPRPFEPTVPVEAPAAARSDDAIGRAFADRRSNVQVQASGAVVKVLVDDEDGSRHQRFIVQLPSGQTVLIAHNTDLAPRVAPLSAGDTVEFKGEYEWNDKGGVVHWTHRDPARSHPGGWIRRDGATFQ